MDFIAFIMSLFFVISPPGTPVDEEELDGTMSYEHALLIMGEGAMTEDDYQPEDISYILEEPLCPIEEECEYIVDNLWLEW